MTETTKNYFLSRRQTPARFRVKRTTMSPRCTLIGAATSPTTSASATAGLVTIQTNLKMNIKLKVIQNNLY